MTITFLLPFLMALLNIALVNALIPAPVVHTVVGAIAGSAGALAAYPIDFVKSQLQTEQGRIKYKGGFDAAIQICRTEGSPFALYRGVAVNIIGVAPEKTIKLTVNDAAKVFILAHYGSLPLFGEIVAGGMAGMTQVIVTNPLEVVKVKMQTSDRTVQQVIQQEIHGLSDLYQGAHACILRDVVFSAVLFPLYAHGKQWLLPYLTLLVGQNGAPEFWCDLLAGSFAAGPSAIISTPADVIKTRLQQSRDRDMPDVPTYNTTNLIELGSQIMAREGRQVLFSGWFERVVRSVPQFGVTLAMFDVLNRVAIDQGWVAVQ
jgi:solute carrier family 25 aspartate/glutamate transporter 12/13